MSSVLLPQVSRRVLREVDLHDACHRGGRGPGQCPLLLPTGPAIEWRSSSRSASLTWVSTRTVTAGDPRDPGLEPRPSTGVFPEARPHRRGPSFLISSS